MSKTTAGVPLKEELTNSQIQPVLDIIGALSPYLLQEALEAGGTPKSGALNGEPACAAQATFIRACARLDAIIEDESRWSLKSHNTLIAEMVKTHRAQQKFIATQQESAANLQAPHFLLRPTLAISGGRYVAYWGDINEAGRAVVGQGDTPNEALVDFDDAFDRTPEEQIFLVAEKAGIKLDKPADPN